MLLYFIIFINSTTKPKNCIYHFLFFLAKNYFLLKKIKTSIKIRGNWQKI